MSIFKQPELVRDGQNIAYRFSVEKSDIAVFKIYSIKEKKEDVIESLKQNPGTSKFLQEFLDFSNKFFTKKYTFDVFKKHLIYDVQVPHGASSNCLKYIPDNFYFTSKGIVMNWIGTIIETPKESDASGFEFPELLKTTAADIPIQLSRPQTHQSQIEEVDDIAPADNPPTIDLDDDSDSVISEMSRSLARAKVRAAQYKAKIARLKAERTTEKYLTKYGASYSDLEDSETDAETEVEETDDDDEN